MWHPVRGLTEGWVDGINQSSLTDDCSNSIIEGHQAGQTQFALSEAMLSVFYYFLVLPVL